MTNTIITLLTGIIIGMYAMTIPGVKPATEKLTRQTWTAISKAMSDYARV